MRGKLTAQLPAADGNLQARVRVLGKTEVQLTDCEGDSSAKTPSRPPVLEAN